MQFMYCMYVFLVFCDEVLEEFSDEEFLDSCVELIESERIEVLILQVCDQGQLCDQCGLGWYEVGMCIFLRINEREVMRMDEDYVKRIMVFDILFMCQVRLNY